MGYEDVHVHGGPLPDSVQKPNNKCVVCVLLEEGLDLRGFQGWGLGLLLQAAKFSGW